MAVMQSFALRPTPAGRQMKVNGWLILKAVIQEPSVLSIL